MPENVMYAPPMMPQQQGEAPDAEKKDIPPGLLAQALQIPIRRWQATAVILVVSGAVGLGIGYATKSEVYTVEGTLTFPKAESTDRLKGYYAVDTKETLSGLVLTTDNLQKLISDPNYKIDMAPTTLARLIKLIPGEKGANVITLQLEWEDREQGAKIINRLMDLAVESIEANKVGKIAAAEKGLNVALKKSDLKIADNKQAIADLKERTKSRDPKADSDGLKKDLETAKKDRDTARQGIAKLKGDIDSLGDQIAELDEKARKDPAELMKIYGKQEEYVKEAQAIDKERIEFKGKYDRAVAAIPDAETKYNDIKRLFDDGQKATKQDVAAAEAEWSKLKSERDEAKQQLERIAKNEKNLPYVVINKQRGELDKKREQARLDLAAAEGAVSRANKEIDAIEEKRRKIEAEEAERLYKKADELEKEREDLQRMVRDLGSLPEEGRVQVPANVRSDGASNLKKKFIPPFAVTFVLLMGLLVGSELKRMLGTTTNVAARMGLPVLAQMPLGDPTKRWAEQQVGAQAMQSRGLALKLRQFLPENGGTILFTALNPGLEVEDLISDVCRHLTLQDEHVLIVDTRITDPQGQMGPPWLDPSVLTDPTLTGTIDVGLVQYLVFDEMTVGDKITRTRMAKADYLPAGGPCSATDVLASQQMRELIPQLRKRYSVVLMIGPPLLHQIDVEILAGYVDGIVITLNKPLSGADEAIGFVRNLRDLRAPLLGCVLCG